MTSRNGVKLALADARIEQKRFGHNLVLIVRITAGGISNYADVTYRYVSGQWDVSHNALVAEKSIAVAKFAASLPDDAEGLSHLQTRLMAMAQDDNLLPLVAVAKYGQINSGMTASDREYLFDQYKAFDPSRARGRAELEASQ